MVGREFYRVKPGFLNQTGAIELSVNVTVKPKLESQWLWKG